MNDFLQNLRGSSQKEKKPTPKTRRSFDNTNQYNSAPGFQGHSPYQGGARGAGNVKRQATRATAHTHMPGGDHQPPYLSMDPMDVMVELIDIYTKNQELLINVQERRVMVEERKAIALEEIAEYIRVGTSSSTLKDLLSMEGKGRGNIAKEAASEEGDVKPALSDVSSPAGPEKGADLPKASPGDKDDAAVVKKAMDDPATPAVSEPQVASDAVLSSDSDDDGVSAPKKQIAPDRREKKIREKTVAKTEPSTAPSQGDDLFQLDSDAIATPKREDKASVLRKKVTAKRQPKGTVRKTPKKPSAAAGSQTVTVIKRKKAEEKVVKEKVIKKRGAAKDKKAGGEGLLPRDEVMAIINSMREKGATFDQVAQHLVELGQPTFSGRGEWHAQTIHRLCNKKEKKKKK